MVSENSRCRKQTRHPGCFLDALRVFSRLFYSALTSTSFWKITRMSLLL